MTKPSVTVNGARAGVMAIVFAAMATISLACAKTDKQAAADSSAKTQALAAAGASVGAPMPGALTKPIDQYTGDEFFAFTNGLRFGGGVEAQRRCKGAPGCNGGTPNDRTRIRLDAVDTQDSVSVSAIPGNGVLSLRALNVGQFPDSMYGMAPGARYEYFLIVLPGRGGAASWRLEQLDTTSGSRVHRSIGTGAFQGCNHPFVRGARANFKSCASATIRPAAFGRVMQGSDDPMWFSCAQGCCTADGGGGGGTTTGKA